MTMKEYTAFHKASALQEPHHHIVYGHIQDTCLGVLPLSRDAVGVFYCPADWATKV